MYDEALKMYKKSSSSYDAGIVEGLKRIIRIMEDDSKE